MVESGTIKTFAKKKEKSTVNGLPTFTRYREPKGPIRPKKEIPNEAGNEEGSGSQEGKPSQGRIGTREKKKTEYNLRTIIQEQTNEWMGRGHDVKEGTYRTLQDREKATLFNE